MGIKVSEIEVGSWMTDVSGSAQQEITKKHKITEVKVTRVGENMGITDSFATDSYTGAHQ